MIAMINYDLYSMKVVVVDDVDPSIEFKRKPSFLGEQVKISQVFHCEGLLLCILEENDRVVVWNSYCGQTRWIELRYSGRSKGFRFTYALGYENIESSRTVKLLRFIDFFSRGPEKPLFWYENYDLDTGLWTTLDITPHWCIAFCDRGVFLKGKTYWCAKERNLDDDIIDHIICFDFTSESFGPLLPLPSSVRDLEYEYVTLSCVREEKLAALFQHNESYPYELEIWITTKIDVEMVSWSKFLTVNTGPDIMGTSIFEDFFIDEEKKIAMIFKEDYPNTFSIIGEAGYLKKLDLGVPLDPNCWPVVCSYVPRLVQIKEPVGGKRKRESSFDLIKTS